MAPACATPPAAGDAFDAAGLEMAEEDEAPGGLGGAGGRGNALGKAEGRFVDWVTPAGALVVRRGRDGGSGKAGMPEAEAAGAEGTRAAGTNGAPALAGTAGACP
ncbi:MAG: hypothetical protein ACKOKG_13170 [Verrucomicrobiota bacterium]